MRRADSPSIKFTCRRFLFHAHPSAHDICGEIIFPTNRRPGDAAKRGQLTDVRQCIGKPTPPTRDEASQSPHFRASSSGKVTIQKMERKFLRRRAHGMQRIAAKQRRHQDFTARSSIRLA
jgi:hypothetical protein